MIGLIYKSVIALIIIHLASASGQILADEDILGEVDAVRAPSENFTFKARVIGSDGVELKLAIRIKDRVKSLVRYIEPARSAGRSLLFVGRNMWVYVPGSRQVLRISPQQRILGGVASADIARIIYSLDYTLLSVENIPTEGDDVRRRLTLAGKSKRSPYDRVVLVVAGREPRPLQARFFASSGKRHLKTAYFEGYREILGRQRPTILRVVNHLNADQETLIEYYDFTLEDTPDAWFQPAYLKRLK